MVALGITEGPLLVLSYIFYALAAVSLAYTVYTAVRFAPRIRKGVSDFLNSHSFTRRLVADYGFRTRFFAALSLIVGVAFSGFNAYLGIIANSVWFGALAAYNIMMTAIRGLILLHSKRRGEGRVIASDVRMYRATGVAMLLLNFALSAAIAQMIFDDRYFDYPDLTVFAFAAFAFYKITMAIYNMVKSRKQSDLTVRAIRDVNLTGAMVSILALQTALLHTFDDGSLSVSLFNTLTGSAVSLLSITLSILMIVGATKKIKSEKSNINER